MSFSLSKKYFWLNKPRLKSVCHHSLVFFIGFGLAQSVPQLPFFGLSKIVTGMVHWLSDGIESVNIYILILIGALFFSLDNNF